MLLLILVTLNNILENLESRCETSQMLFTIYSSLANGINLNTSCDKLMSI